MHLELSSVHSANIEILTKHLLIELEAFHCGQIRHQELIKPNPSIIIPDLETIQHVSEAAEEELVSPFVPVENETLESVIARLNSAEIHALSDREFLRDVTGHGIYELGYIGNKYGPYKHMAAQNLNGSFCGIYVGAVVPGIKNADMKRTRHAGFERWGGHQKSIEWVKNLDVEDFIGRYVSVDDATKLENLVINYRNPLWNKDPNYAGFGYKYNEYYTVLPGWDIMHPGRPRKPKSEQPEPKAKRNKTSSSDVVDTGNVIKMAR